QASKIFRIYPSFQLVIPARLAWAVQEFPSFALPLYYITGSKTTAGTIVLLAFLIHYFNRFVTPITYTYHSQYYHPGGFSTHPFTYLGIIVFASGMYINIRSDSILRNLKETWRNRWHVRICVWSKFLWRDR
ncbi:hypothetical protein ANCDUO_01652, partial [Ancylostoma duodenale]